MQRRFHRLVTDKITDASRHIEDLKASAAQLRDAAGKLAGAAVDGPCDSGCSCLADGGADTPVALLVTDDFANSVACTLPAEEVPGRLGEWRQNLAHEVERRKTTDGLRIELDTTVDLAALTRLVVAEQACCAFFSFAITVGPEGAGLEVGAPAGAGAMVQQLLGALPA